MFISIFEDFSEEEFLLGALRTNMMIGELEEWEAQEKLQALTSLMNDFDTQNSEQVDAYWAL